LKQQETILLVDDEEELRNMVHRRLSIAGYCVFSAANGKEALGLLASCPDPVHLLLTDIEMPGMNGVDLAECAKRLCPRLKVLFISGFADDFLACYGLLPTDHLLRKPFSPDQIAGKVREILDKEMANQGSSKHART